MASDAETRAVDREELDAPGRLGVLEAGLLDRELDGALQGEVEAVAQQTRYPIALVSLVTRHTQYFRAHTGLPADLAISRATDRCSSFCQFVVSGDSPLEVEDAAEEAWLPQELVQAYGIRAYVGVPLRVGGQTVGSLCIIDTVPRRLGGPERRLLEEAAGRVARRLEQLRARAQVAGLQRLQQQALQPALGRCATSSPC